MQEYISGIKLETVKQFTLDLQVATILNVRIKIKS